MAKKKKKLTEIEVLDKFLRLEGYHEIYEELTDKDSRYFELFEPLGFFQVFSRTFKHIEKNKSKPLSISKFLQKELALLHSKKPLTDKQRYFFYDKLLWWFENIREEDKQLNICCREIEKLKDNLEVIWKEVKTPEREDVFAKDLKHLETLPSEKDRIAYLIQRRAEEQQSRQYWKLPGEKTLAEKYGLEIDKRKELMKLEESQAASITDVKKHKDLTLDRAVLLVDYIFKAAKVNCKNTQKAKVISFLTGYSENTIVQSFSRIEKEKLEIEDESEISDKFYNDMKIVRDYVEKIGLAEAVKIIDKDLGN